MITSAIKVQTRARNNERSTVNDRLVLRLDRSKVQHCDQRDRPLCKNYRFVYKTFHRLAR